DKTLAPEQQQRTGPGDFRHLFIYVSGERVEVVDGVGEADLARPRLSLSAHLHIHTQVIEQDVRLAPGGPPPAHICDTAFEFSKPVLPVQAVVIFLQLPEWILLTFN